MLNDLNDEASHLYRGISFNRPESELRADLGQWLETVSHQLATDVSDSQENVHNKRFAMMALNIAKDLKTNPFAATYRALYHQ